MVYHVLWFEDFFYEWEKCDDADYCGMLVHHDWTVEEISSYPREWMETLVGFCIRYGGNVSNMYEIFYHDVNGLPHRDNGPALKIETGELRWYQHGVLHRENGPAVVAPGGRQEWWLNGLRHRVDGPAFIDGVDVKEWWVDGRSHRVDGPAVMHPGKVEWRVTGRLHRLGGPARERMDGTKEWWENGIKWKEE